jgi:hypothetical protein
VLKALQFKNYRCFRDHRLPLKTETIVVGKNNAGKSTSIEGFRLISLVTERFPNLNFRDVPDWLPVSRRYKGARVDLSGLGVSWANVFHRYEEPPAVIEGTFETGYTIQVYLGPEGASHTIILDPGGTPITSRGEAGRHRLPRVSVLPQVAPLDREERILNPDYVRANVSSYLAPRHFRNQLKLYPNYYRTFKELVEATWPAVQILEFRGANGLIGDVLDLLVRDGDFVAEVACMGHGLQMWLQTMWFISRTSRNDTVVLDEPDVYMHPDLQRRLIRHLRSVRPQVIVATHSTEILSETDATNVLVIDRHTAEAAFSTSLPTVQKLLDNIGSAQNIQLTRLWSARKLLLVEGKDVKFLSLFHQRIFPDAETSLEAIPNMPIGGWNGWPYAVGSAMLLRNSGGEAITTYCVLDSDYFSEEEKEHRLQQAVDRNVELHIWSKKEIENYLIVPAAIHRLIHLRLQGQKKGPSIADVEQELDAICEALKHDTIDALAQHYYNLDKAAGIGSANRKARTKTETAWKTAEGRLSIISGKEVLSRLSAWSKKNYGVSFGALGLAQQIRATELANEMIDVIRQINFGRALINETLGKTGAAAA